MSRLVLHVGLAKTGTTAFQAFLAANKESLAETGLHYPDMLRGPNHAQLAAAFSQRITGVSRSCGVREPEDRTKLRQRLRRKLGTVDQAPSWIVSSEHISTMLRRPEDISALSEFVCSIFDEVLVVVVVRRSDYWVPSAYVESVKAGSPRPLDGQFVRRRSYLLDHQRFLRRWSKAFGADHVRIVPFLETDKSNPALLPARILAVAGVPTDVSMAWPTPPHVRNESLSGEAIEVIRQLNATLPQSPMRLAKTRRAAVTTVRQNWPGRSLGLTPLAADELLARGWVRTGVGQTRYAASDGWEQWSAQPDAATTPPATVRQREVALATRLLREQGVVDAGWTDVPADAARRLIARVRGS
jgi:hypothetical protein